jgi:hypothetical protein
MYQNTIEDDSIKVLQYFVHFNNSDYPKLVFYQEILSICRRKRCLTRKFDEYDFCFCQSAIAKTWRNILLKGQSHYRVNSFYNDKS